MFGVVDLHSLAIVDAKPLDRKFVRYAVDVTGITREEL
jgi:hypothetical protein